MKRAIFTLILLALMMRPWDTLAVDNIRIAYPSTSFTTMPILAARKFALYPQEGLRAGNGQERNSDRESKPIAQH